MTDFRFQNLSNLNIFDYCFYRYLRYLTDLDFLDNIKTRDKKLQIFVSLRHFDIEYVLTSCHLKTSTKKIQTVTSHNHVAEDINSYYRNVLALAYQS